jgi:hypothetical protein
LTYLHSVVAIGCVRTLYFGRAQRLAVDKFWLGFNVFVTSVAESNLSIVCACAPSLKALFGRYFRGRTTKMSDISENSRLESTIRSLSSRSGLDRFTRGISSNKGLNSNATSIDRRFREVYLQDILEVAKVGRIRWSFKEAHEYGMESLSRITEAYEEPPYSHEESATVQIFLDTENVRTGVSYNGGTHSHMPPPIPTNPVRQEMTSPHPSSTSEAPAGDEKSSSSSFSFINPSESPSSEGDETHLISSSVKGKSSPASPRYLYIPPSPSKQSPNSIPLQPPTPAILRTPSSGTPSPLLVAPWAASMTNVMLSGTVSPNSRRKLRKVRREKWEQQQKKSQFEQTAHPVM